MFKSKSTRSTNQLYLSFMWPPNILCASTDENEWIIDRLHVTLYFKIVFPSGWLSTFFSFAKIIKTVCRKYKIANNFKYYLLATGFDLVVNKKKAALKSEIMKTYEEFF